MFFFALLFIFSLISFFLTLCRYTTRANCDRARFYFKEEKRDWLVVTERFHYFYRLPTRGIKKMIFYGLPSFPDYYNEVFIIF